MSKFPPITDEFREEQSALVFFGEYGSQSYTDKPCHGYRWVYDASPEWLPTDEIAHESVSDTDCFQVIHNGFSEPKPVPGYFVAYEYETGEHECPWCSESWRCEDSPTQDECQLCEQTGYIYWGEEFRILVYAPFVCEECHGSRGNCECHEGDFAAWLEDPEGE